jgi:hypothetical protein
MLDQPASPLPRRRSDDGRAQHHRSARPDVGRDAEAEVLGSVVVRLERDRDDAQVVGHHHLAGLQCRDESRHDVAAWRPLSVAALLVSSRFVARSTAVLAASTPNRAADLVLLGADDGIRTDLHLGNVTGTVRRVCPSVLTCGSVRRFVRPVRLFQAVGSAR